MIEDAAFAGRMNALEKRYNEVSNLLGQPEVIARRAEFTKLAKEHAELDELVQAWREMLKLREDRDQAQVMLDEGDSDMRALAREELSALDEQVAGLGQRIKLLLLPRDPNDERNVVLEIRAGTGGDEAALFAGDLFRMYMRFAERRGWKAETLSATEGASGGFKEVIALFSAKGAYSIMKYESGVHRVQRVPATEASGRIHTSAATVAVLPEAEEVDVHIEDKDLRFDVFRSSGPGGQSVNTTDSAVRVTHLPTSIMVVCQDEKSQHKNKAKALKILRSRLLEHERERQELAERDQRRAMVRTGDRSEKIRTYNFPQDRLTDHRIGLTRHNLPSVLDGDLSDIIQAVRAHFQAVALEEQSRL
ncbi:MAG TPA: peptide chain release factor 1 [Kofleriaceae bacterium]|nr:peptide chain release factor 1 [Kofleriaceae bacterium]